MNYNTRIPIFEKTSTEQISNLFEAFKEHQMNLKQLNQSIPQTPPAFSQDSPLFQAPHSILGTYSKTHHQLLFELCCQFQSLQTIDSDFALIICALHTPDLSPWKIGHFALIIVWKREDSCFIHFNIIILLLLQVFACSLVKSLSTAVGTNITKLQIEKETKKVN